MESLQFEAETEIYGPDVVSLSGESLTWNCAVNAVHDGWGRRAVDGCLDEFIELSDSSSEEILAFALRRGVLGIAASPEVTGQQGVVVHLDYTEPISVYRRLSLQARSMLLTMGSIRSGELINKEVLEECFAECLQDLPGDIQSYFVGDHQNRVGIYHWLRFAASRWAMAASYRLGIDLGGAENRMSRDGMSPGLNLEFRLWAEGYRWDKDVIASRSSFGDLTEADLPSVKQRLSPLFNVIAFQLAQRLALPTGSYLCSQCNKLFQHDPQTSNKPRSDIRRFCGPDCRKAGREAYWRERYHQKKAGSKKAAPAGQ